MKLLLVEDNALLARSVKQGLEEEGWIVDAAIDGEEGFRLASASSYHVVLLDSMLPKLSGPQIVEQLRAQGSKVPILMLTAKSALADRVAGLEVGADDYLVKPFEMAELFARVKALYRRSFQQGVSQITAGKLVIDPGAQVAILEGVRIDLTSMEFDLLATLAGRQGQIYSREELTGLLYKTQDAPESNSLDVLMARVRRKVKGSGVEIITVRGKGFLLRVEETPS